MRRALGVLAVIGVFVFAAIAITRVWGGDMLRQGDDSNVAPVSSVEHENRISGEELSGLSQSPAEIDSTNALAAPQSKAVGIEKNTPVFQKVPFTSQAPLGEWGIGMYQDGCEEASVLMAHVWTTDQKNLSSDEAERDIRSMTQYEQGRFGVAVDLSPEDTADLFREYWKRDQVSVVKNVSKEALIDTLYENAIIIAPTDGKVLKNPNFTAGGPDRHMLLLVGYDPKTKEFVTNDPGTRRGEGYRYDENILYGAIRAYKTGDHEPIGAVKKDVIVVRK